MHLDRQGYFTFKDLKRRVRLDYLLCRKGNGHKILLISKRMGVFDHIRGSFRAGIKEPVNMSREITKAVSRGKMPDYNKKYTYEDVVLTTVDEEINENERFEVYEVL